MHEVHLSYCVQRQVPPHVVRCDPVQHGGTSQCTQTLGHNVEESTEEGHLRSDQIGKGHRRVDVSAADVTDGLDEGGGSQPKAKGDMKNVMGPCGPAESCPQPKEYKEHGAVELRKHCPPEGH